MDWVRRSRFQLNIEKGGTRYNISLEDSRRFSVNKKFSIFKNLGVGWWRTAANAHSLQTESRYVQSLLYPAIDFLS